MTTTAVTVSNNLDLLAGFSLALRITGDEDGALTSVVSAARNAVGDRAALIRAVRTEARARRRSVAPDTTVERPASFAGVAPDDWQVLERVALRGMSATEAAASLGLERHEVLSRLQRGLLAARACLAASKRQLCDDARAVGRDGLRGDRAAGVRHDPVCNRQAETTAAPLISR